MRINFMRRALPFLVLLLALPSIVAAQALAPSDWKAKVAEAIPLLGHRNWILIVDSAYPLQAAPGIETVETDAGHLEVVHHVLGEIEKSIHVRPVISLDAELPFVAEEDAPGASRYRTEIAYVLRAYPVESVPHDRVIANIEEASKHFNVLVLKTKMTIPYTSVFIRLDCKYWSADAEKRLRAKMAAAAKSSH
jgi:hypothetical protein